MTTNWNKDVDFNTHSFPLHLSTLELHIPKHRETASTVKISIATPFPFHLSTLQLHIAKHRETASHIKWSSVVWKLPQGGGNCSRPHPPINYSSPQSLSRHPGTPRAHLLFSQSAGVLAVSIICLCVDDETITWLNLPRFHIHGKRMKGLWLRLSDASFPRSCVLPLSLSRHPFAKGEGKIRWASSSAFWIRGIGGG